MHRSAACAGLSKAGLICFAEEQQGKTLGFVVMFDSVEDRDYYVNEDPAHREFVKLVMPEASGLILDFTDGYFKTF